MNNFVPLQRGDYTCAPCRFYLIFLLCLGCLMSNGQYWHDDVACSDFGITVFETDHLDSISRSFVSGIETVDTAFYVDHASAASCSWSDFTGPFDIDHWTFHADNYDGTLHHDSLPRAVYLEGASNSPINNHRRYVSKLQIPSPTSGYVTFDWKSFGGHYPHIDAFYFTVNDSCVQLSNVGLTHGHFVSWYVNKGDTISFEQTSNGSSNHITTKIFNFEFIPEVYQSIDRHWKIVQGYDTMVCVQQIEVSRPALGAFEIPANRDGYDAPTISCTTDWNAVDFQFPYFQTDHGRYALRTSIWNDYSVQYSDQLIAKCGGSKKIRRTWILKDHCSHAQIESSQIIVIKDDTPIEIACPQDQRIVINKCAVTVGIRKPKAWTSCNEQVDVDIEWAYGSGSRYYYNVVPGRYEIKFTAKDGCGRSKTCSMWLDLVYENQDEVICKSDVEVLLPNSGTRSIAVADLVHYTPSCSSNLLFKINGQSTLNLDCSDLGVQYYTIDYIDASTSTHYGSCDIAIDVKKAEVQYHCPDDVTLGCNADLTNLDQYGTVQFIYGLSYADVDYNESWHIDACNSGHIIRTWDINVQCGIVERCTQKITISGNAAEPTVRWPEDYTIELCDYPNASLDPQDLPLTYGPPIVDSGTACGTLTVDYSDLRIGGDECHEIRRTWVVKNNCHSDQVYTHTQILEIKTNGSISLTVPADQIVYLSECDSDAIFVQLSSASADLCGNGVAIQNNSPYADQNGADASGTYPIGLTEITFSVTDQCGNYTAQKTKIEVIASEHSTTSELVCIGEFEAVLQQDDTVNGALTFNAAQLVLSPATDACSDYVYKYAFSQDVSDAQRTVTCSDKGLKAYRVYRQEKDGSWTSCEAWVSITDPYDYCSPAAAYGSVSGKVVTPDGTPVKYANMSITGVGEVNTDAEGIYVLGQIPAGQPYQLTPVKNINDRNGINTIDMVHLNKHLLGVEYLSSPYKIIACDINNSQSVSVADLYKMNRLVLGIELEMDDSWKFVPADYTFTNPQDPFDENFPNYIPINLSGDLSSLDFIGVKSGDPNLSADPSRSNGHHTKGERSIIVADVAFDQGEQVNLEIDLKDKGLIDGLQMTLVFDPTSLAFENAVNTFGLDPSLVINKERLDEGIIGIVFINYNNSIHPAPLTLEFSAKRKGSLQEVLTFNDLLYQPEVYIHSKIYDLKLEYEEAIGQSTMKAYPNPFRQDVQLDITVQHDDQYTIEVFDMLGTRVNYHIIELHKGLNTITLNTEDFENEGVYVLRVSGPDMQISRQVIRVD